jgi:hypothetical protein
MKYWNIELIAGIGGLLAVGAGLLWPAAWPYLAGCIGASWIYAIVAVRQSGRAKKKSLRASRPD